MNRRSFLSMLSVAAASAAAPVYFDMGKNSYLWHLDPVVPVNFQAIYELKDAVLNMAEFNRIYKEIVLGMCANPEFWLGMKEHMVQHEQILIK